MTDITSMGTKKKCGKSIDAKMVVSGLKRVAHGSEFVFTMPRTQAIHFHLKDVKP